MQSRAAIALIFFRGIQAVDAGSVRNQIRELLVQKTGSDAAIDDDRPLGPSGIGLDSVAMVELVLACEDRFGLALGEDLLDDSLTPRALADAIVRAQQRPSR